jgi:hypothetical protein
MADRDMSGGSRRNKRSTGGRLFDTTNGLRQTDETMMARGTASFSSPATGLVVVTITILPL